MSTTSMSTTTTVSTTEFFLVAYYPLCLIVIGTVLNLLTFIILCRSPFRDTKKQPAMHYMRAIAIFDIFMLYGWNLDNYLSAVYGFTLLRLSIPSCKFISFISYIAPQTSAWLRVFCCLDRYLSLSRLNRTRLNKSKSILIIIACIIGIFFGLNFHFLLFACYIKPNGAISANAKQYTIYPLWNLIHLGIYNCAPFILMIIFDSGVIYHLIRFRRTTIIQNSRIQHRSISITLVTTSSLFLIMTIPSGVSFAFFQTTASTSILHIVDAIYYSYHVLSFPLYIITFTEFRREFIAMIKCINNERIAPINIAPDNILTATRTIKFRSILKK